MGVASEIKSWRFVFPLPVSGKCFAELCQRWTIFEKGPKHDICGKPITTPHALCWGMWLVCRRPERKLFSWRLGSFKSWKLLSDLRDLKFFFFLFVLSDIIKLNENLMLDCIVPLEKLFFTALSPFSVHHQQENIKTHQENTQTQ